MHHAMFKQIASSCKPLMTDFTDVWLVSCMGVFVASDVRWGPESFGAVWTRKLSNDFHISAWNDRKG